MTQINKNNLVSIEGKKENWRKVGKAIRCKQCQFTVEHSNITGAMYLMAQHKRIFRHMPQSVDTFDVYDDKPEELKE